MILEISFTAFMTAMFSSITTTWLLAYFGNKNYKLATTNSISQFITYIVILIIAIVLKK